MFEVSLPDGRRCRLVAHQRPPATDRPVADGAPARLVIRCEIEGAAPIDIRIDAGWEDAERLPEGLADLIIRHFLLA
jgi:hypothetical protein